MCTRVPNIITEAIAVSLMGFFSGPFFATVCIYSLRRFTRYHLINHDTSGNIRRIQNLSSRNGLPGHR
jgi:hypothetical protein